MTVDSPLLYEAHLRYDAFPVQREHPDAREGIN